MGFWERWRRGPAGDEAHALYAAAVERARAPHWFEQGGVPDTLDGRFDMVTTIVAFVILRLESEPAGLPAAAALTERFVADMDGQLREIGIGDVVVGKHIGRMMGLLGGRLGAYRDGLASGDVRPALIRNLYRGTVPQADALDHAIGGLSALQAALAAMPLARLTGGELP